MAAAAGRMRGAASRGLVCVRALRGGYTCFRSTRGFGSGVFCLFSSRKWFFGLCTLHVAGLQVVLGGVLFIVVFLIVLV